MNRHALDALPPRKNVRAQLAAALAKRQPASLDAVLKREERQLIVAGLHELCKARVMSMRAARLAARSGGRHFEPRDFDIPTIKRLIERLGR